MQLFTVYGASDDLVEASGCKGADEFNCYGDGPVMGVLYLEDQEGNGLRIICLYEADGVWSFAVAQRADGERLPDWTVSTGQETDYSTRLTIEVPDSCLCTFRKPEK